MTSFHQDVFPRSVYCAFEWDFYPCKDGKIYNMRYKHAQQPEKIVGTT